MEVVSDIQEIAGILSHHICNTPNLLPYPEQLVIIKGRYLAGDERAFQFRSVSETIQR